jgi:hypothetical protein
MNPSQMISMADPLFSRPFVNRMGLRAVFVRKLFREGPPVSDIAREAAADAGIAVEHLLLKHGPRHPLGVLMLPIRDAAIHKAVMTGATISDIARAFGRSRKAVHEAKDRHQARIAGAHGQNV